LSWEFALSLTTFVQINDMKPILIVNTSKARNKTTSTVVASN